MFETKQLNCRLPRDLYRRLESAARREGRTVYALAQEILSREARRLPVVADDRFAASDDCGSRA